MNDQNRNLILATALSFLVILVWFVLFPPEEPAPARDVAELTLPSGEPVLGADGVAVPARTLDVEGGGVAPLADTPARSRAEALARSERVVIDTPRLTGSISLIGGRLDDLSLKDYRVSMEPGAETVTLLSPVGVDDAHYAIYGWAPGGALGFEEVPGASTPWTLESGTTLSPGRPVVLVWESPAGLTFRRKMEVDEDFLFTVTQSVTNASGAEVRLAPYGIVARHGEPDTRGFYILHEGMLRMTDGTLEEKSYSKQRDMRFDARENAHVAIETVASDGWIGFTDHYWMTTLMPGPGVGFTSVAKYTPGSDIYQTEMRLGVQALAPGETREVSTFLFAGAKEWETIRKYEREKGIDKFVDSIDWGWFFFLTKPIFQVLHWLNGLIGNMGWAIIGLTLIIKAVLFPLAYKSYVSMAKMKELQPEMEKIKERAGDDRQKLQQEIMAMYREKKVNPAAGCLPILLQIPIFFSLYKVIFVTIELRHAPFIGWIRDLSAPDPSSIMNLFGLLPWDAPDPNSFIALIFIGILPILLGVTMWLQMKLNPAPTDETQKMIFGLMPWMFMFILGGFASGLVIYWIANNVITFIQQYSIMRISGHKPDLFGNIASGFKRKAAKEKAKAGSK
jgi:YidC/Oxa1 family membrane protein insertase